MKGFETDELKGGGFETGWVSGCTLGGRRWTARDGSTPRISEWRWRGGDSAWSPRRAWCKRKVGTLCQNVGTLCKRKFVLLLLSFSTKKNLRAIKIIILRNRKPVACKILIHDKKKRQRDARSKDRILSPRPNQPLPLPAPRVLASGFSPFCSQPDYHFFLLHGGDDMLSGRQTVILFAAAIPLRNAYSVPNE